MIRYNVFEYIKHLELLKEKNNLKKKTASILQRDHSDKIIDEMRSEWKQFEIKHKEKK